MSGVKGASPSGDRATDVEPVPVSPLRDGIPSAARIVELTAILGRKLVDARPVGSRVTCDPPPCGTDEDWLVLLREDDSAPLTDAGFRQEGSPEFYTGNDNGGFRSWRRGDWNVVTTLDQTFFERFMTATALAKRFNLLAKPDRIALFQAVLYGVHWGNLQPAQAIEARSAETLGSVEDESAARQGAPNPIQTEV